MTYKMTKQAYKVMCDSYKTTDEDKLCEYITSASSLIKPVTSIIISN